MSTAPLDDRINARAQLGYVARGLYGDPTEALRRMRHDAHVSGAATVRRTLEDDFTHYGEAATHVRGATRERAQTALREGGVAAAMERWLTLDHNPSGPQLVPDDAIHRVLRAPDAETAERRTPPSAGAEPQLGLNGDERIAFDRIAVFAEAKERADQRQMWEARLYATYDHRDSLAAAEADVPRAKAALRDEVGATYADGAKAMEKIEAAMQREGPADTARRIRSGDLLKGDQRKIAAPKRRLGVFPYRDRVAEAAARECVAMRIETLGYREEELGKWSTFQPQDGPVAHGARNVRAALDREEAKILTDSGIGLARRSRPAPPHPSREASELGRAAQQHLGQLPPASRERVLQAARRSGMEGMGSALGHLQTIQMAARTFREGIEGPGH